MSEMVAQYRACHFSHHLKSAGVYFMTEGRKSGASSARQVRFVRAASTLSGHAYIAATSGGNSKCLHKMV